MVRNVSSYLSWASEENIAKLRSIQSNYSKKINEVSTELGKIDMTGWQDDVSSKLSGLCTSMKDTYCKTISDEVNTGNLEKLITFVTQLKDECLAYKELENESYVLTFTNPDDKTKYKNNDIKSMTPEGKDEYYWYIGKINQKNENLSIMSQNIDNILLSISSLEFNKNSEPPTVTSIEVTDDNKEDEEPAQKATRTENTIGSYIVGQNGIDHSNVIEIIETTEDGKTIRSYIIRDYDVNGELIGERPSVTVIADSNDPAVGTVVEFDPDGITRTETVVERDSNGNLIQTWTKYDVKTGKAIDGGSPTSVEDWICDINVDSKDGKVSNSQEMNLGNPVEKAMFKMDYRKYYLAYDGSDGTEMGFQSMITIGEDNFGTKDNYVTIELSTPKKK